jgi:hypothetical protein
MNLEQGVKNKRVIFCRVCCFQTTHELIEGHWICCLCKAAWTLRFARIADPIRDKMCRVNMVR